MFRTISFGRNNAWGKFARRNVNRRGRRPSLLKSEAEKPLGGADPRPSGRSRERRPPARGEHREGRGGGAELGRSEPQERCSARPRYRTPAAGASAEAAGRPAGPVGVEEQRLKNDRRDLATATNAVPCAERCRALKASFLETHGLSNCLPSSFLP